ncbi:UNVERIFIED_CONTAM: Glutamate receptor 2.8 [Sesamum calycinum]|uniref:Glutamate receptor 2.8 n=1 Tax=Sesamum calycinum TaxID=2727403 RepID=A0AAW2M0S8_9LAMI
MFSTKVAAAQIVPVRVGVVLDMDDYEGGSATLSCISMALSDFYATHAHYRTRLVLTNRDSKGDVVGAAAAALDLLKNVEVQAIIVEAIGAIVKAFGWREVVLIYEDNEFGEGIAPYLTDALEQKFYRPGSFGLSDAGTKAYSALTSDALSSPKGWVIPTNGKKLRVGVPIKEGFTEFVRVTWNSDNSTEVEGYCIDVFDAVMAALPYGVPYEYIPFAAPDHKMAGDYNAFTYQVYLGNFDAVSGDVTIVGNRSQYIDFTLPYTESGVSMVVPIKDDKSKNAWVFVKPLTWELWLTSFCSFVFIGILIWILEHRINEDFRGPFWYQVGMIFWFAFSTMVFAHKEKVVSNLARFVLIIWFLVVLILTQSYTASLASMLTVQKLQPTVNDVNVLIRNKEYVGYMKGSFIFGLLKKMNFDESRLVEYKSPEELDELLTKGSGNGGIAAAFHEIPYIKLFLSKYCSKYMTVEPIHKADGLGFVFPIGSPLVTDVSRAILNVTEGQTIVEIERKWLGDYKTTCDTNTLLSPKSLGLASFWGLFLLVGIAGIAAFIIYVVRFLRENWSIIDDESTIWSKIVKLLTRFDNKDLKSHTFKHIRTPERDDAYGSPMHSPHNNCQQNPSYFSLASPHTNGPPSPVLSSPAEQTTNFQGDQRSSADNATRTQQGESAQTINQEIELSKPNEHEQTTSTLTHQNHN